MNLNSARVNMIKQQLRTCAVLDDGILQLLQQTPREDFVPREYREFAFADLNIPIGHEQVMMTPLEEAKIIQALQIQPHETVLEVGTGTGYLTALLAQLAKEVITIEYFATFCQQARININQFHLQQKVTIIKGDGSVGWPAMAPYDAIVMTGSMPVLPKNLRKQLKPGGRLFTVMGSAPSMEAILVTYLANKALGEKQWQTTKLFETQITPLINAIEKEPFVF